MVDPWADPAVAEKEYGVKLADFSDAQNADCVIVAVAHKEFRELGLPGILKMLGGAKGKVLIDVKSLYGVNELKASDVLWWRL